VSYVIRHAAQCPGRFCRRLSRRKPRLRKKSGGEVWCNDCHVVSGKPTPKIIGNPRDELWAIEWMATHMVETFETKKGNLLYCKSCHKGALCSPEFQRKIILNDRLPAD
jgi:hypothetical protein